MSEEQLLRWLAETSGSRLIGDDAAVMPERERWAITMDTQIEGTHFLPDLDAGGIARRLLAVNLSDLAAMGASPAYAFCALATSGGFDHREFFGALLDGCKEHGMELAGGDLARSSQTMAVLTLLGRKSRKQRWLRRDTARAGEQLWLGGTVGEAAIGCLAVAHGARIESCGTLLPKELMSPRTIAVAARRAVHRFLLPQPQLALGQWLGSQGAGAAIDVSDGLALDLHRMCEASGLGAEIDLEQLPLATGFRHLADRLERDWRKTALGGGEDYVLLFSLPVGIEPPEEFGCVRIGHIKSAGISLRYEGHSVALAPHGWDHLSS